MPFVHRSHFTFLILSVMALPGSPCSGFTVADDSNWAFRQQNWEEVVRLGKKATNFGHRDVRIPDSYGTLYYKYGVAFWHLGKWQEASSCFEVSFVKYWTTPANLYRYSALKGWADCQSRLSHYDTAIRLSKKFHFETDQREKRKPTPFDRPPAILRQET